jgi:hypothetical protein
MMTRIGCVILLLSLTNCKTSRDKSPDNGLRGKWIVDQVVNLDSSSVNDDELRDYESTGHVSGSLFYKAKELKSTIELLDNGVLMTKLVFTNFGTPTWATNKQMDSLTLKLVNVTEESLIADGTVSGKGELFLYEGKINFLDSDNVDWTLSDGRIFKLKRKNAP